MSPRAFSSIIAAHGPEAVAFYLSGQLLTEDYYVANKLMKGFIGSAMSIPIRGCACPPRSPATSAFRLRHGAGLRGSRPSRSARARRLQCRLVPSGAVPRIQQNRSERGAKVVVIDPRVTATAEDCDLLLRLKPGTDSVLFAGCSCISPIAA
jgi:assimilatory nitrate reductase catalytic subunit